MKWLPKKVRISKRDKEANDEAFTHLVTASEDGQVIFWDTRQMTREKRLTVKNWNIEPCFKIQLLRFDGTGDMGITRLLFDYESDSSFVHCTTDEGDICLVDWAVRPPGGEGKRGGVKKEEA